MSNDERTWLTRRTLFKGVGAATAAGLTGCASEAGGGEGLPGGEAGGEPWQPFDGGAAEAGRATAAAALLAPIDTYVVLCMENRPFDHYLGSLRLAEGRAVDGLTGAETNPAPGGGQVPVFRLDDFTPEDPPHSWEASHQQWNGGLNDGFVIAHAGASQAQVMGYHTRDQLPVTYALSDGAAVCDRWFASVMGPTWPNRFYLHGATSNGIRTNVPSLLGLRSIFRLLSDAGLSGVNYFHDVAWALGGYFKLTGLDGIEKFFQAAESGTLPTLSIIDPQFFGSGANDDHPDHDIRLGQALIGTILAALAASPQWSRCLFVLTYDEHGGFFDHVPPGQTVDSRPDFRQLGFRVPALVAGPYVRAGVVSAPLEHTSVISTLSRRFSLPTLNQRVAATNDLSVCIDPGLFRAPRRAPSLPPVAISRSTLARRAPSAEAHHELRRVLESGAVPSQFDRRGDDLLIAEHVLERGARLGAVRLLP